MIYGTEREDHEKMFVLLSGVLLLSLAQTVRADVPDPDVLIKETVREVLDVVRKDQELRAGNQKNVGTGGCEGPAPFQLRAHDAPGGGQVWRTATPEQKQALMNEFRILLVRTYTKAFTSYRDQLSRSSRSSWMPLRPK